MRHWAGRAAPGRPGAASARAPCLWAASGHAAAQVENMEAKLEAALAAKALAERARAKAEQVAVPRGILRSRGIPRRAGFFGRAGYHVARMR